MMRPIPLARVRGWMQQVETWIAIEED